jgi:predicted DNA-binding transcriptional regulator YafY
MPLDFKVDEYVQDALGIMRSGRRIEVELLTFKKAATWVKDKSWHASQDIKLLKDGRLRMMLKVADNDELVGWILSFGSQARVIRPDALEKKIKDEARKILRSLFRVSQLQTDEMSKSNLKRLLLVAS